MVIFQHFHHWLVEVLLEQIARDAEPCNLILLVFVIFKFLNMESRDPWVCKVDPQSVFIFTTQSLVNSSQNFISLTPTPYFFLKNLHVINNLFKLKFVAHDTPITQIIGSPTLHSFCSIMESVQSFNDWFFVQISQT